MSLRIHLTDFSDQYLSIGPPINVSRGGQQYKIFYKKKTWYVQGPPCVLRNIKPGFRQLTLQFPIENHFTYFRFFATFDEFILKHFQNHHQAYQASSACIFGETHVTLHGKVSEQNTKYFDEDKQPLDLSNFNEKDLVIPILYSKGVFVDSNHKLNYRWTIEQLLRANRFRVGDL